MAGRLIDLLKVIQWVSNGVTNKARLNNTHSQPPGLTTKKNSFSSTLNTSLKSITDIYSDILLNYKLVSLNCKHVDVWRSTHLPVQLRAPPAMLNSSSSIKRDMLQLLWRTVNTISGISLKASQKREKKSPCSVSPGGEKAASVASCLGKQ